jgi:DNA-binding response OmpR family regulator
VKEDKTTQVLCVEDNPDEGELIKVILTGYEVTWVATIEAALTALDEASFDLVIIDEHLPDGSGLRLCDQLTRRGQSAPVIMVSGDPFITSSEVHEAGAKVFLNKNSLTYVEDLRRLTGQFSLSAKASG